MVDQLGVVTLIDFDRAERIHGECNNCADLEVISLLETSTELPVPDLFPYQL
jgi:hypothetical protein